MNTILNRVERIVTPTEKLQREKEEIIEKIIKTLQKIIQLHPQVTGIEIVGSFAKGTWLPEKADIDIFIKLQTAVPEKEFSDLGKKIGFAALKNYKPYVRYSQHPFVEAQIKGTKINIVPCYDVLQGNWKSAADRSPYHTKFMINSLSTRMKTEVRILKEFLRANDIYGAEIAKQGFSGYVAEVLVLNFGSFQKVIEAFSKIKQNEVIGNATKEFESPIIIMDPIDSNRNLGAAISSENVAKFVLASRAFLKKPSISFFELNKKTSKAAQLQKNVLVLSFRFKQRSPDIIWGQLKRASTSIATQIEHEGFVILRKSIVISGDNYATLLFLLQEIKLNQNRPRIGPDVFTSEHVEKFISSNKKKSLMVWINEEGKVCTMQKRDQTDAVLFLKKLIKKEIDVAGIPAGLAPDIKRFKVSLGNKVTSKSIKEAVLDLVSTDEKIFSS
ncbi:MAG TPA: CCA tRNA nucleotidyltransferase [Candidatus Nitrosotenuis sp.]|nr:CCA tRNA nucleotidyltransferase [Candidatus Nitrosotenuis sp.]